MSAKWHVVEEKSGTKPFKRTMVDARAALNLHHANSGWKARANVGYAGGANRSNGTVLLTDCNPVIGERGLRLRVWGLQRSVINGGNAIASALDQPA
jgi:hypothetical protein